ncbi:MAG: hypothetical protein H7Y22_00440 [Gemmatimonadaceae bacterium]|nr:hypothetical protein [Gloeobacterales cyanobacterium ES-bin-141]
MGRAGVWGCLAITVVVATGLSATLSPPVRSDEPLSATVTSSGGSYGDLVRKAEALARQKISNVFKSSQAQIARISINGKNRSLVAPLLDVQISRAEWNKKPASLRMWSTYYDAASLLSFSPTTQIASAPAPDNPTGKADPSKDSPDKPVPKSSGALKLLKSNPAEGEERARIKLPIELSFAAELPIKKGEDLGLKLEPDLGGQVTINKTSATFVPERPLAYSQKYTLTIEGSKQLKLPAPISVSFKTEPQYTYQRDVRPMLAGTCTSCHSLRGTQRAAQLDSYEALMQYVVPGQGGQVLSYTGFHGQVGRTSGATQIGIGIEQPAPTTLPGYNVPAPPNQIPSGSTSIIPRRRAPLVATEPAPDASEDGSTNETTASAPAYTRGGALTQSQAEVLRTWIIQDQAIEK